MSYSSNRSRVLDLTAPIAHRISHLRSCAVHMAQKYDVTRAIILEKVGIKENSDEDTYPTSEEIEAAMEKLDEIKLSGLDSV